MKTIKADPEFTGRWTMVAQNYLLSTRISCFWLKNKLNKHFRDKSQKEFLNLNIQPEGYLIYPTVYNLKHGLEIFLKCLIIMLIKEYPISHDTLGLFNCLKNIYNKKSLDFSQLKTIKPIIEKYYYGRYLPSNKINKKGDIMNEAERFPENDKTYIITDPLTGEDKVNLEIINNIDEDAKKIINIFRGEWKIILKIKAVK